MNTDTQARIVVVGIFTPQAICIDVDPDFGTQDEWQEIMASAVDALPEQETLEAMAARDAINDQYHPPFGCALADYDRYVGSWFAARERMAHEAADLADYQDDIEDRNWHAGGLW